LGEINRKREKFWLEEVLSSEAAAMAAPQSSSNVMIAIPVKRTTALDLIKPLKQYIAQHFSERDAPEKEEEDLKAVQQMRNEVDKPTEAYEMRRDLLQRYFRALSVIELKFPFSNEKEHINNVYFTWYDAFKQGRKASQQNIHFEKAAIAFNLGAIQSQLGLSADRTSTTGIKQACNSFQAAGGVFAFLRDNISIKAAGSNSTLDISVESAGMLERLMLAQAQECFFEKVVNDGRPASLCSKVAKQVGIFYEEAYCALVLPPLIHHLDRPFVVHVQLKAAQYHAEACYQAALDLHEKEEIGQEIARLMAASTILSEAKKSSRAGAGPLMDAVVKLEVNVNRNLDRAKRENDRLYLIRVPTVDSLPPLPAAVLAYSTPVFEVLDASTETLFSGLVPESCKSALSTYLEMVDDVIRCQAGRLQQASELTRSKLQVMDLPDSLVAIGRGAMVPGELRDKVEAVQSGGGPSHLAAEMTHLQSLRRTNGQLLAETQELLEKESSEDSEIRAQFGARWTRPQSSTLTRNLHNRATEYATKLKQAADSDTQIERTLHDNMSAMEILDTRPIEKAFPSLRRSHLFADLNEDDIVGGLRQKLNELEQLGLQRAGLEDRLKDMKLKDNILLKLMSTSGPYDDLFQKELGKYDTISVEVGSNIEAQEQLLQQIRTLNDTFCSMFEWEDYKGAQDKAHKQVEAAISKFREIQGKINEGLKFYTSVQAVITNLKQQCSDYVMTRKIQSRDMIEDLQRKSTGMPSNFFSALGGIFRH
jgi:programmed cell death 6-interacting protein